MNLYYIITSLLLGLIDEGESAAQAAIRELREETGYEAHKVVSMSPVIVSDPGINYGTSRLYKNLIGSFTRNVKR